MRLWPGCFTVDRLGQVIASTLPQGFPAPAIDKITRAVLPAFEAAREARLPLNEIQVHYPALKITARPLRGGAIVFVAPLHAPQTAR